MTDCGLGRIGLLRCRRCVKERKNKQGYKDFDEAKGEQFHNTSEQKMM